MALSKCNNYAMLMQIPFLLEIRIPFSALTFHWQNAYTRRVLFGYAKVRQFYGFLNQGRWLGVMQEMQRYLECDTTILRKNRL